MSGWHTHDVDIDGPVRVVDYGGTGDALVCVHGLGGWALDWQILAPQLTRRGNVIALDLPGFGDSPLAARSATIDDQQRLLDRFLEAEIGRPAVLLGNSMGATIAILQAVRRPASVSQLVLVSPVLPASVRRRPHPAVAAQFAAYAVPRLGELYLRARRDRFDARALVDRSLAFISADSKQIPRTVFEERYALVERLDDRTDAAFLAAARSLLGLLASPGSYQALIDEVTAPVLVVHGADDPLVSPDAARHLAMTRPDWTIHVLPDVGHVPMLEASELVGAIVGRWLDAGAGTQQPAVD